MRKAARKRIPRFAYDYLSGGIGLHSALRNNRDALDNVIIIPRYLVGNADHPRTGCTFLGEQYDFPFGVAPVGLGGIIWPQAAQHLASAAQSHNIPFCLSGFATASIGEIADVAGKHAWYQHYMCADEKLNEILFKRALDCGYENLIITVDIPTVTRRDHDIRNGLSVPPRLNLRTLCDAARRPRWAMETLLSGVPQFQNYREFFPKNANLEKIGMFIQEVIEGHASLERLKRVRDQWPHNLIVKGVLNPDDARDCLHIGVDAIVVSNHGGRQLDAAPSAIDCLPAIRDTVGPDFPLIADGGVLTGLDIIRYLGKGADFVFAGRAFMYAVGAMGKPGAAHVMNVLSEEFRCTMAQIGCGKIADLPGFLEPGY